MIPLRRLALALLLALALVAGAAADPFEVATYAGWNIATVQNHGSEVYIADGETTQGLHGRTCLRMTPASATIGEREATSLGRGGMPRRDQRPAVSRGHTRQETR